MTRIVPFELADAVLEEEGGLEKTVSDRIGHANMAYTLALYIHPSTGKDRAATESVAGVLLGIGWTCAGCGAAYIGTAPENGRCKVCADDDGVAVPA